MLLRMYVRWGEKQRYKTRVVEKSMGEEAGIKSATIELEGRYAYGYMSGEKGTHRIVRQSPFNSKGLRQVTSKVLCIFLYKLYWYEYVIWKVEGHLLKWVRVNRMFSNFGFNCS